MGHRHAGVGGNSDGTEVIRDRLTAPASDGSFVGTALAGALLAAGGRRLLDALGAGGGA